jgi:methionyl-tRNA formyltransferase
MRLIFMGTPAFAVPSLRRLLEVGHEVALVITQPDRPAGRGQRLTKSPVKQVAEEAGLPVMQPVKVRDQEVVTRLRTTKPDAIVVVDSGQILSRAILEIPPYGCINVHASLLPKYRGAAPIAWALIRGETVTGVTIMEMVEAMDAGPILLQRAIPITDEDDAGTLHERLAVLGAEALIEALDAVKRGEIREIPQEDAPATFAPKLTPDLGRLDWTRGARELWNLIRGLSPQPGAYTFFRNRLVRVLRARPEPGEGREIPGVILGVRRGEGVLVATGEGRLLLLRLQPEGKRVMTAEEFAHGYRIAPGAAFVSPQGESPEDRVQVERGLA